MIAFLTAKVLRGPKVFTSGGADYAALTADIAALTIQYGRYGYRRITAMSSRGRLGRAFRQPRAMSRIWASARSRHPWPGSRYNQCSSFADDDRSPGR